MSTDTVSPLRQRMIEDMNARKLCAGTQRGHIRSCKRFAAFLKRSPDTATAEDIRRFQLHLAETGVSICNRNRIMTGVRFLFRVTLRRLDLAAEIYHLREPQKIPLVMSPDETRRLLAVASSLKVRVLLSLGYGCGLRAGEVVRLKVKHIDSAQKIIRVEQSKGRKDRNVMLSPEMLDLLRQWWKVRPRGFDAGTPAGGTLAVSRPQARQADDDPPAQPPVPRGGRCGRDQEGRDAACAAPQLRDPPARARHRYQNHPGASGSRQIGHDGALHPRRHRHDRRHREPARPAVAAAQEAQEEQEGPAAGVTAAVMSRPALEVADIFRDHGAAWRRANAGHVSLDQMKVMRAIERCRTAALGGHVARCENETCAHTSHRLQQLPQPALPEVSGRGCHASGWPSARPSSCRCRTFMSCSRCRRKSPISPIRTRP